MSKFNYLNKKKIYIPKGQTINENCTNLIHKHIFIWILGANKIVLTKYIIGSSNKIFVKNEINNQKTIRYRMH